MTAEQKVLWHWRMRASGLRGTMEQIESNVRRDRYEVELMQQLLDKSADEAAQQKWQAEIDVLQSAIHAAEDELLVPVEPPTAWRMWMPKTSPQASMLPCPCRPLEV